MTGTLAERLRAALQSARKARDRDRTLLFSTVLADLRNREIELRHPLTEDEAEDVLRRGIKRRRESIEQYEAGRRPELAERERREVVWIEEFLPPALDDGAIRAAVRRAIKGGATQLGPLMAQVMPELRGRADGQLVNRIAREELSQTV